MENVINMHPDVIDSVVMKVKTDNFEAILLCNYMSYCNDLSKHLRDWCADKLLIYEIPKMFVKVEEISYNKGGKKIRCTKN